MGKIPMPEGGFVLLSPASQRRIVQMSLLTRLGLQPMTAIEKLQRMEGMIEQRIEALKREGSDVPKHGLLWLTLVADALNQHTRARA